MSQATPPAAPPQGEKFIPHRPPARRQPVRHIILMLAASAALAANLIIAITEGGNTQTAAAAAGTGLLLAAVITSFRTPHSKGARPLERGPKKPGARNRRTGTKNTLGQPWTSRYSARVQSKRCG